MKKVLVFLVLMSGVSGVCSAATTQSYIKSGAYFVSSVSSDTVVSVSTSTYTTSDATQDNGVIRIFQDTGAQNILFSWNAAGVTTSGCSYLVPGEEYVEDIYMGNIYFLAVSTASNLSIKQLKIK